MGKISLFFIRFYQLTLSAFVGSCCRFQPTCSEYAQQAIREHGLFRGSYLAIRRILRCHPGCAGGYDPVPKK